MNDLDKILIVEDEIIVAKDLEQKLINLGYDVPTTFSKGEEAISEVKKLQPNLVLMDIKLDGRMDGIEAGEQIRKQFDVPIIFLTAYGDRKMVERSKQIEPNGYIMKPFNIRQLHNTIQIALHKSKMEKKLKRHHNWVVNTLQSMGNAVVTIDINKKITFINSSAHDLLGINDQNPIGEPINSNLTIKDSETNQKISLFPEKTKNKEDNTNLIKKTDNILVTQEGKKIIVDTIVAPLKKIDGTIDGYVISLEDVTERKEAYRILQKMTKELERRVEKRTKDLQKSNETLQNQIIERQKAEEKAKEMQSSIENIINSTSEIIIALDSFNRVKYWNNSAEKLTGFKKKDVFGRYITKLPFINDSKKIKNIIDNVYESKEVFYEKVILITKDYSKRILHLSCSPINSKGEKKGVVFVGKDITYDWESHHNLLQGHSYLIAEKNKRFSLDLFSNLIFSNYQGVYITRSHPDRLKDTLSLNKIRPIFIRKKKLESFTTIHTLPELINQIKQVAIKEKKTVLFVDGIHYFVTHFSFNEVINALYEINETIADSSVILLFYFDPEIFSSDELAILRNEFERLPSKKIDDIKIKDELFDILKFIEEENKKNALVSYKKIMSRFDIVYYTASKRVKELVDEGLVFTKKYGKSRVVHLSEKAKSLLTKRDTL